MKNKFVKMCTKHLMYNLSALLFLFFVSNVNAQSSGDASPEHFSFQKMDASNMVNQLTGDFSYSVPLLTVPSPEGGYQVNLNYAAGIKMNQDASWVGLGWSLSPGALNRDVNGSPDDIMDYQVHHVIRDQGTIRSEEEYKQLFLILGHWYWYHNNSTGANTNHDWEIGFSTNMQANFQKAAYNIYSQLSTPANYTSRTGFKVNSNFVYKNVAQAQDQATIQTKDGFFLDKYVNEFSWKIFGDDLKHNSGSLYLGNTPRQKAGESWQDYNYIMDMYTNTTYNSNSTLTNNQISNNLSFPNFDSYYVTADGISGVISPFIFKDAALLGSGYPATDSYLNYKYDASDLSKEKFSAVVNQKNEKMAFLFVGAHNSNIKTTPGNFSTSGPNVLSSVGTFNGGATFNGVTNAAGKYVEAVYNTNSLSSTFGQITSFNINNENGTVYSFGLPVYQFERVKRFYTGERYDETRLTQGYAYAWLLTSITGPDFINNSPTNNIGSEDGGYWVKFNYGTWTSAYVWRTPGDNIQSTKIPDELSNARTYEWGRKQLTYLNSIETRTHKAYFIKFVRNDGMGSNNSYEETVDLNNYSVPSLQANTYNKEIEEITWNQCSQLPFFDAVNLYTPFCGKKLVEITGSDGYPVTVEKPFKYEILNSAVGDHVMAGSGSYYKTNLKNEFKQKVLGLKKIILVRKNPSDPDLLTTNMGTFNYSAQGIDITKKFRFKVEQLIANATYTYTTPDVSTDTDSEDEKVTVALNNTSMFNTIYDSQEVTKYDGNAIIDEYDLAASNIESQALQIIEFNHDYSLCNGAPSSLPNTGRLTLKDIKVKGKGGYDYMPPYKFTYAMNEPYKMVTKSTPFTEYVEMVDDWGYRVVDNNDLDKVINKDKMPKDKVASWSLTQIETPLGAKIKVNYESDKYTREASNNFALENRVESASLDDSDPDHIKRYIRLPIAANYYTNGNYYSSWLSFKSNGFILNQQYHIYLTNIYNSANNSYVTEHIYGAIVVGYDDNTHAVIMELPPSFDPGYTYSANSVSSSSYIEENASPFREIYFSTTKLPYAKESKFLKVKFSDGVDIPSFFTINNTYEIKLRNVITPTSISPNFGQALDFTNAILRNIITAGNYAVFELPDRISDKYKFDNLQYSYAVGNNNAELFGGGIRVKEIISEDEVGNQYKTRYSYSDGITAYAPGTNNLSRKKIHYMAELPPPGVQYAKVIEENVGLNGEVNSSVEYQFETMNALVNGQCNYGDQLFIQDAITNYSIPTGPFSIDGGYHYLYKRIGTIHNNTATIGRMSKVLYKNKEGIVINTKEYSYYDKNELEAGIFQQSFHEIKDYFHFGNVPVSGLPGPRHNWYATYSSKIYYPSVLKRVTETSNGVSKYSLVGKLGEPNNGFDIATGLPLVTFSETPSGEEYKTEITPAYKTPLYANFGSKASNANNKNRFTDVAYQKMFVRQDGEYKLLSSTANKLTESNGVFRPSENYVWKSLLNNDGTLDQGSFVDYNFATANATQSNKWQKSSEVTKYDHFSHALETKDINNNFSATKFGFTDQFPIISASGATYNAIAYTGAEDINSSNGSLFSAGEISGVNTRYNSSAFAHTGNYSSKVETGTGFVFNATFSDDGFVKGKKYRASVWVHETNASNAALYYYIKYVNDAIAFSGQVNINSSTTKKVGDFYLLTLDISIPFLTPASKIEIGTLNMFEPVSLPGYPTTSAPVYFDDFRVHPFEATVTTSVYDDQTGWLIATLDNDNFATKYYYDNAGRLIRTDKETANGFRKVSEALYHYGRPQ